MERNTISTLVAQNYRWLDVSSFGESVSVKAFCPSMSMEFAVNRKEALALAEAIRLHAMELPE